jgi:hypothetical protein
VSLRGWPSHWGSTLITTGQRVLCYGLVAQGSTLYAESKRLNDESIPSPGWRFKSANAGKRKYGTSWSPTTVAAIVHQTAYSGTHKVKINGGETLIERSVPAI